MIGEKGNVAGVFTVPGFGFVGQGQNVGITFVRLKHWSKREGARNRASAIALRANGAFRKIAAGMAIAFVPPVVQELGNATGFDFQLVDVGGPGNARKSVG